MIWHDFLAYSRSISEIYLVCEADIQDEVCLLFRRHTHTNTLTYTPKHIPQHKIFKTNNYFCPVLGCPSLSLKPIGLVSSYPSCWEVHILAMFKIAATSNCSNLPPTSLKPVVCMSPTCSTLPLVCLRCHSSWWAATIQQKVILWRRLGVSSWQM